MKLETWRIAHHHAWQSKQTGSTIVLATCLSLSAYVWRTREIPLRACVCPHISTEGLHVPGPSRPVIGARHKHSPKPPQDAPALSGMGRNAAFLCRWLG
ncbi:hypothetical protein Krac_10882 [Ktedonobacter racemifer DSM 44963]|uniref:Uncharacterized protein n=1 Tax=Ktedonobacter racemifer DSM 44963 TaxID=485913 RepID=D6TIS6_KTERA|nr:hypothetical protein Krac_10882 [Ktedonobacter racemifer DSM 44963]